MRTTVAAATLAFALTLGYAAWIQPEWEPQLNDQFQYLSLARGLVERGEFTRARQGAAFIPETNRLPGYPILVAPTCIGGCDHWRIAVLQAGLYALLVVASASLARRIVPLRSGAVAFAVALYVPFAYFGALALSDLAGAMLFTLAVMLWLRSVERASTSTALAAGALFGWAALMRGALLLAPLVFAATLLVRDRGPWRIALAALAATALVFLPYIAYSEASFGRPYAGNSGAVLWLGVLEGRDEASLDDVERAEVAAARVEIAALDAADRDAQPRAWLALDDSLGARARRLIAHDPLGWVARSFIRSAELWAGERPLKGGATGDVSAALGAVQLVLFAAALAGAAVLVRRRELASVTAVLVIAYVWITALPFQTEARYALPAMPFALIAAVAAFDRWSSRAAVP